MEDREILRFLMENGVNWGEQGFAIAHTAEDFSLGTLNTALAQKSNTNRSGVLIQRSNSE